jgi:hypothetical protein
VSVIFEVKAVCECAVLNEGCFLSVLYEMKAVSVLYDMKAVCECAV